MVCRFVNQLICGLLDVLSLNFFWVGLYILGVVNTIKSVTLCRRKVCHLCKCFLQLLKLTVSSSRFASNIFLGHHKSLWNHLEITLKTKIRVYNCKILLNDYETWSMRLEDIKKLSAFNHSCLRCILRVRIVDKISYICNSLHLNTIIRELSLVRAHSSILSTNIFIITSRCIFRYLLNPMIDSEERFWT